MPTPEELPRERERKVSRTSVRPRDRGADEALTRKAIDTQLRDAGWIADTQTVRYSLGARPKRGVNQAIAEWPTVSGPADYVLFAGLTPLASAEAKRHIKDIPGHIPKLNDTVGTM